MAAANHPERKPPRRMPSTSEGNRVIRDGDADAPTRSTQNGGPMDQDDIFMTASLDSAESQCIRSEYQVTLSSSFLVICSLPSSIATIAAPRSSCDRLPIMPPRRR